MSAVIRKCKTCRKWTRGKDFPWYSTHYKGVRYQRKECRSCHNAKCREKARQWRIANPELAKEKWRRDHYRKKFGLTVEQIMALLEDQDGCCAICLTPLEFGDRFTQVDHCHETGVIRGIICFDCNTGLGRFKDSTANLLRAVDYLNGFGGTLNVTGKKRVVRRSK